MRLCRRDETLTASGPLDARIADSSLTRTLALTGSLLSGMKLLSIDKLIAADAPIDFEYPVFCAREPPEGSTGGIRHTRPATVGSRSGYAMARSRGSCEPWRGPGEPRRHRSFRSLHRRDLCPGEKRGLCVGKTKRGKGTKIMAISDRTGLPVAVCIESASRHEVRLVEDILDRRFLASEPERLIGDKAYDSDALDQKLWQERSIEMIASIHE